VPGIANCIEGRFLDYWRQNGGLPVFGYPISPATQQTNGEGTFLTQYFERNRFEYHADKSRPYDVLLGRLGDDRLKQQGRDWTTFPKAQPGTAHYFAETGHAIAPVFWGYWSSHGLEFDGKAGTSYAESLALFGLPLSEPMMETNSSGDTVVTQWFERARFEDHGAQGVLLGLLVVETTGGAPPQAGPVLYPCDSGLCSLAPASGQVRVVAPFLPVETALYGYAVSVDGTLVVYALGAKSSPEGTASIVLADADGSNPRRLFTVRGVPNGMDEPSGYGVLGLSADNTRVIFEDQAQVFVARLDGSGRRPVTPQLRYGASVGHVFLLSPGRTKLLVRSTTMVDHIALYDIASGVASTVELDAHDSPAFWGGDDDHVALYRFDKPYDPEASFGYDYSRVVRGYREIELSGKAAHSLPLAPSFRPRSPGPGGGVLLAQLTATGERLYGLYDPASGQARAVAFPGYQPDALGIAMVAPAE
jgi:hypothetical protein